MQRKNIIMCIEPCTLTPSAYSNFKKMCEVKELPYHYLKRFKFPIVYKDLIIHKIEVK
jgi:hypothetical protein